MKSKTSTTLAVALLATAIAAIIGGAHYHAATGSMVVLYLSAVPLLGAVPFLLRSAQGVTFGLLPFLLRRRK